MQQKPFVDALRRALARWASEEHKGRKALDLIAENLVNMAVKADKFALLEVANRLDGKPHQSSSLDVTHGDNYEQWTDEELMRRILQLQSKLAGPGTITRQ